jgi:hypothetical protein
MRLLIYLLALMSGFSAADAARADVGHSASVAQATVVIADALVAETEGVVVRSATVWPRDLVRAQVKAPATTIIAPTPITRRDVSLQ